MLLSMWVISNVAMGTTSWNFNDGTTQGWYMGGWAGVNSLVSAYMDPISGSYCLDIHDMGYGVSPWAILDVDLVVQAGATLKFDLKTGVLPSEKYPYGSTWEPQWGGHGNVEVIKVALLGPGGTQVVGPLYNVLGAIDASTWYGGNWHTYQTTLAAMGAAEGSRITQIVVYLKQNSSWKPTIVRVDNFEFTNVVEQNISGNLDGVIDEGEYDVVCYDMFGARNSQGTWVSENVSSITDIYRWGCKVKDGVFYGFVELKNRNIGTIDNYGSGVPKSFYGFFIDVDNNPATGYAHSDFPNDNGFDIDLEVGNDYGYLCQSGTINFWYGADNFGTDVPASNANAYYSSNVLEISCPVADILAQAGVSAENGRFWRIAPRTAGKLPNSGAVDYAADVVDPVVIDITNKAPKVIPTVDGVVSAEEWAGGMFCDRTMPGLNAETDGTATASGTSDIARWGAKIINGVYYGFVEIDLTGMYSFDAYNDSVPHNNKYRRINVDHYLDIDGNMTNGVSGNSIPTGINMDKMFDLAFECEIREPSNCSPMKLYLADTTTLVDMTNVIEFWNTPGESFVYEWSCPMSSMESWAAANGSSVQDVIRVMAKINGNLRDIIGDVWSVDVTTPAMVKSITLLSGDANLDDQVDVGDLGILAANYGLTSGAKWDQGDFNGDGKVDVGDLGILAANYGTNNSAANFDADYAKVFGATAVSEDAGDEEETTTSICSSLGLSLVAGLALMGLMLVKMEE
jgi:hypothetical protein